MIDLDKDGEVDAEEYEAFYKVFGATWIICDADKDNFLIPAELTTCLATPEFLELKTIPPEDHPILMDLLDQPEKLTIYGFVFLRRIDAAMAKCAENGVLPPNKLYCAL